MPNAFQAWDSDAKAAVMSGLGKTQQTPPIPPGADFSYGRATSWYLPFLLFWKCKEHLNRHVK